MDMIVVAYSFLFCILWCVSFFPGIRTLTKLRVFERENPPAPEKFPRVSVLLAARNEAETIESAVSTLLDQDYPSLEIVAANDRSTDGTAQILDRLAETDSRLRVVHIETLPEGWLGKVYALDAAIRVATGEWILFTDADVHFQRETLKKGISLALSDGSDHLAILPRPKTDSFWYETVILAFGAMFVQGTRVADLPKKGTKAFVGAGAFNLVRRRALESTEGFGWLRMEIVDDLGLGLMLRRSGAKSSFAVSLKAVSLVWYPSLSDMFRGLEKNLFGAFAGYSFFRMSLILLFMWGFSLAPLAAIAIHGRFPPLLPLAATAYLFLLSGAVAASIKFEQRLLPMLFVQAGQILISLMLLRSGLMCLFRGGILWRDSFYPIEALREGQRVRFLRAPSRLDNRSENR